MSKSIDGINIVDTSGPEYVKQEFFKDCEQELIGSDENRLNLFLKQDELESITDEDLKGLTKIGQSLFNHQIALKSISIPSSITRLEENAFQSCYALTDVVLPETLTYLGANCFYYCSHLEHINIPSSLTQIAQQAFYYCTRLTELTLPASVSSIGHAAFQECGSRDSSDNSIEHNFTLNVKRQSPPTLTSYIIGVSYVKKIVVPQGTLATYKAATNWSFYADYMEESTEW